MTLIQRLVRAEMLEVLRTDYIRFARARGLTDRAVHFGHALRNTLVPVITITGLQLGAIIAFAIITETVFQWPGMGLLFIQAVSFADVPVMAAYLCLIALFFVIINLVVDLLYYAVDPRLRIQTHMTSPVDTHPRLPRRAARIRRDIHAHPELAFEESRTSDAGGRVAEQAGASRRIPASPRPAWSAWSRARRAAAEASACAPTWIACRCTSRTISSQINKRRPDARLRPRRPHHHAARRGALPRRDAQLRRHRLPDLPARGGRRRRREGDDQGRPVRALPGRRDLRAAQLAGHPRRARSRCAPAR